MQKSHLTAYKLSLASIATIYIHNTSCAVSASDIRIVYLLKYLVVHKIADKLFFKCFSVFEPFHVKVNPAPQNLSWCKTFS